MMLWTLWISKYCAYLYKVVMLCILQLYIWCLLNKSSLSLHKKRMYNYWQSLFQVCELLETSMSHREHLWAPTLRWFMSINLFLLLKEYDRRKVTGWDWMGYQNEWYPFKILPIWKILHEIIVKKHNVKALSL